MDLKDPTESSLTSEPDDLTELHQSSRLPTEHHSRRTESGFVIRASRLPDCVPLPASKIPLRSWVWDQGIAVGLLNDKQEVLKHWLCTVCYHKDVPPILSTYLINAEKTTTKAIDHLEDIHQFDRLGNKILPNVSKKRKGWSFDAWREQQETHHTVFDEEGWRSAYCRWFVSSGISLHQATSDELKGLLCFQNPRVKELIPQAPNTARTWVLAEYAKYRQAVVQAIAGAKGKVTISFDGWKANNDVLDLLGVVVHYLGDDNKLHNVVLAMRDTLGSHTGANVADHLFDVLKDYQISGSQIAFFAADNANNNDRALQLLSERVALDPVTSRLRCAGHIFNLVCTAILFGVDKESLDDAQYEFVDDSTSGTQVVAEFEATLHYGTEAQQHRAWLSKGPVGKLHNLVSHIKANNSRIALFESKQTETTADRESSHTRILRLVNNGGIRWNSTYLMIERAIHLRDALTLYQSHEEATVQQGDQLDRDDWEELGHLKDLLAPIYEVSMQVQSVGTSAGALHNTLTSMDYLLTHLETRRSQPGSRHFIASLNVGWKKLQKYYKITDLNPSYIMAVFLNPHLRSWFEDHWEPAFVAYAMSKIDEEYTTAKRLYNIDAPERSSTPPQSYLKELTGFAAYNKKKRARLQDPQDELVRYKTAEDPPEMQDPLDWWILHQDQYPVLKHLAFTLLAAPASTAADERLFSIAGNVVNEQRPHTQQPLAQAVQCLRSWHAEGLI